VKRGAGGRFYRAQCGAGVPVDRIRAGRSVWKDLQDMADDYSRLFCFPKKIRRRE
jgi:hypothetical protein